MRPSSAFVRAAVALAAAAIATAALIPSTVLAEDIAESKGFRKAVTLAGVRAHQAALHEIADDNAGTRASGTAGYEASVDYVVDRLEDAGYDPVVQSFPFAFYRQLAPSIFQRVSPDPETYVEGSSAEYTPMTYSGSGDVTAPVTHVLPSGTGAGCNSADFAGFPAGNIALIQRGTCTFKTKAINAQNAGASAVVIYNNAAGPLNGTLGSPGQNIPVIGTLQAIGQETVTLLGSGPVTFRVKTVTESEIRTSWNVIAETASGDPHNVVVVGAHLDSRIEGPGINDNGSGSAAILEIAETFAAQGRTARNKLRFIWFGAEELGLVGSNYYVANLTAAQKADIMLMLNFDMVGSPNYVRFVYDGDNSSFPVGPGAAAGPPGSAFIEQVFLDYFESQGLAADPTAFSGRSDYGPFIAASVGIPAGGLFTGAEGIKTAAQAVTYGGTPGIAYDICYHQACDDYDNVNLDGLHEMTDAAAHAVHFFSRTKVDIAAPAAAVEAQRTSGSPARPDFAPHPEDDRATE
ncbi:MAG TPA: M20/M25/M40 family metallo-hydrolase [Candidatus Limnocylindrales bacterium]|nr:M20/M25/M40 family metallo-hydrolase [Candidatus Limnocylindrales bacterium]